jgi:hypothetical protein
MILGYSSDLPFTNRRVGRGMADEFAQQVKTGLPSTPR